MNSKRNFIVPAIAGFAVGAAVLISSGGASASNPPRFDLSRPAMAAQVDIGRVAPLAGLNSYSYTLEVKAGGTEAQYMIEDFTELAELPLSDKFTMSVKGVVVGPNAQTTLTIGPDKGVMWLQGNRFELKVNSDPIEEWDGPFEKEDLEDTSLYAGQQYWDDALLPWFEANRNGFICSAIALPLGHEARDCAFNGQDETALYDLLDVLSYGSFDEFTKLDVKATFLAGNSAPLSLSIVAVGADEMGASTSLEVTMKVSDVNNASLVLPPAPSTY